MRRTKNFHWNDERDSSGNYSWNQAIVAVLTDIRDEMQTLNGILTCPNFQDIPNKLDRIKRNTAKKTPVLRASRSLRVVR